MKKHYYSHSRTETEEIGREIAKNLEIGDVVSISGELGAGKTVLAKGILSGLGVESVVNSPTFAIVNEYRFRCGLAAHYDLYRVDDETTLAAAGYYDHLDSSVVIVEWGEKSREVLADSRVRVLIEGSSDERRGITIETEDER